MEDGEEPVRGQPRRGADGVGVRRASAARPEEAVDARFPRRGDGAVGPGGVRAIPDDGGGREGEQGCDLVFVVLGLLEKLGRRVTPLVVVGDEPRTDRLPGIAALVPRLRLGVEDVGGVGGEDGVDVAQEGVERGRELAVDGTLALELACLQRAGSLVMCGVHASGIWEASLVSVPQWLREGRGRRFGPASHTCQIVVENRSAEEDEAGHPQTPLAAFGNRPQPLNRLQGGLPEPVDKIRDEKDGIETEVNTPRPEVLPCSRIGGEVIRVTGEVFRERHALEFRCFVFIEGGKVNRDWESIGALD